MCKSQCSVVVQYLTHSNQSVFYSHSLGDGNSLPCLSNPSASHPPYKFAPTPFLPACISSPLPSLYLLLLLLQPFNGLFSRTTCVSRYQKGKTNLDFTEARDSEWHQLGHMQVCTSLQTDNHASTSPLSFLQAGCPSCGPTNSVKALEGTPYTSAL